MYIRDGNLRFVRWNEVIVFGKVIDCKFGKNGLEAGWYRMVLWGGDVSFGVNRLGFE